MFNPGDRVVCINGDYDHYGGNELLVGQVLTVRAYDYTTCNGDGGGNEIWFMETPINPTGGVNSKRTVYSIGRFKLYNEKSKIKKEGKLTF